MKKNIVMMTKISGLGLAGGLIFGAAGAMAMDFDATVTVKNTIAVEKIADLTFGTISVAEALGAAQLAAIEVSTDGTVVTGSTSATDISILAIAGATPAQARVVTGSNFTLQFPAGSWVPDFDGLTATITPSTDIGTTAGQVSGGIRLQNIDGNPGIPDFFLVNLTAGEVTSPGFGSPSVLQDDTVKENWNFTAGAGDTEMSFAIGGTLVTDPDSTGTYQEILYTGTFEVTANF